MIYYFVVGPVKRRPRRRSFSGRGRELRGFEWIGAAHYLLAGVLAGNVWEAWRSGGWSLPECVRKTVGFEALEASIEM